MDSCYKFSITIPKQISGTTRDDFYEWLRERFSNHGLLGVFEGTLLSEEAVAQGLETESWTVDSGEAPRDRDWVGELSDGRPELYFATQGDAIHAISVLKSTFPFEIGPVEEQVPQDWDSQWKASFSGAVVPPFWRIAPPWESTENPVRSEERILKINPGAGFGTGTHETTQLCLERIGKLSQRMTFSQKRALDFGSGSGILSIALALLGANVDAVEIDPLAVQNAQENAALNRVEKKIRFLDSLEHPSGIYSLVVANILRPVLIEFAGRLVRSLAPGGILVMSGLIESDVAPVVQKYQALMKSPDIQVYSKGEWRAVSLGCL